MQRYDFKFWQETGWAVMVAVVVQLAYVMVQFDPAAITDWKGWAIALSGAIVRAGFGAILAAFTNPVKEETE